MSLATPSSWPVGVDVPVLRWPSEEALRQQLAEFGVPRILLVDPGDWPPDLLDEREDWMRTPADPIDLRARYDTLQRRAADPRSRLPVLDDDGLLWAGSAWVALTEAQIPVLRLLLENVNKVVRFEAVVDAYEAAGGSGHPASVRTLLTRLGARIRSMGLELVTVRRRGVILKMSLGPDPSGLSEAGQPERSEEQLRVVGGVGGRPDGETARESSPPGSHS